MSFFNLFQGIGTLFYQDPGIAIARVVLIIIGILLVWLGKRETLEPLIMIPMGFGMSAVNAGVLFFSATKTVLILGSIASAKREYSTSPADLHG